jgi:mRNA interferase RelE/StbE
MHYRLKLPAEIKSQLRNESVSIKQAIGYGLHLLQEDLSGDVKKLKGFKNKYRLRVGDYRVLFELEKDIISVYAFGHRREIYR